MNYLNGMPGTKDEKTGAQLLIALLLLWPSWLMIWMLKAQNLEQGGYRILARSHGLLAESSISLQAKFALYSADLRVVLTSWVLAFVLLKWRSGKMAIRILLWVNLLVVLFFYIQLQTFGSIGRYLTQSAALDSLAWVFDNPEDLQKYVTLASFLKLCALLGVLCLTYGLLQKYRDNILRMKTGAITGLAVGLALAAIVATYAANAGATRSYAHSAYGASVLSSTFTQFFLGGDRDEGEFAGASLAELRASPLGRQLMPACKDLPVYANKAAGHNLVVFSLETMPAEVLRLQEDLDLYPNLKQLAQHALIANKHYSTYPYTSHALFSAYTSMYPTRWLEKTMDFLNASESSRFILPSYLHGLAAQEYAIKGFFPVRHSFSFDVNLYEKIGLSEQFITPATEDEGSSLAQKIQRDRTALDAMKQFIRSSLQEKKKFAALFLPQIGHAPWPALDETESSIREKRHCHRPIAG